MRLPFTIYGIREIALLAGGGMAAAAATAFVSVPAALCFGLVSLGVLFFFRDPERRIPPGENSLVAPADGKVVQVERQMDVGMGCECLKIGIFLSLIDVHVNRSPTDGEVRLVEHRSGRFLNAARSAASRENEANLVVVSVKGKPDVRIGVRQIAGLIARRIVCETKVGDRLCRGQKFGMIKFGSRTELLVPTTTPCEVLVKAGEKVKAGQSLIARFR